MTPSADSPSTFAGSAHHERVVAFDELEVVLADRERAQIPAADAPTELRSVLDVDDLARRAQAELAREERPRVLRGGTRNRGITAASASAPAPASATPTASAAALKAAATDAAELEDVGVLQKEVALLGEEQD